MRTLIRLASLCSLLCVLIPVVAAPTFDDGKPRRGEREFLLKEGLGRSYADELVTYAVTFPAGTTKNSLRLWDADKGQFLPFQVSDIAGDEGKLVANVSFWVDQLPMDGQRRYILYHDTATGFQPAVFPALRVANTNLNNQVVEVANGALGLRLWGGTQTYDPPAVAGTLPGFLGGYRGVDGVWRGGGAMVTDAKVTGHSLTICEDGPLWRTYRQTLTFEGKQTYEMRLTVYPGRDFVRIDEFGDNQLKWENNVRNNVQVLKLDDLNPDKWLQYGVFARNIENRAMPLYAHQFYIAAMGAGACWGGGGWGAMYASDPAKQDVVGGVAIRTGKWRQGGFVTMNTDIVTKQEMQLGMGIKERHWLLVITSKKKAVLTPEQVQATTTKSHVIHWGAPTGWPERITPASCWLWTLRVKWGDFPLNKVKDWVLDYNEDAIKRPDVMFGPETMTAARDRLVNDPVYKLQRESLTGDTQALEFLKSGKVADLFRYDNPQKIRSDWDLGDATHIVREQMDLGYPSSMYILTTGQALDMCILYADVLWGALPREEKVRWSRYALALTYIVRDEDNWYSDYAPGRLAAYGNFNACRWLGLGLASVFFTGHPAAEEWRKFAQSEMEQETTTTISADGVYPECLSNYYPFWWQNVMQMALALQRHGFADYSKEERYKKAARFFIDTLTPPDATFNGHRMIPPVGHHPGAGFRYFGQFAWGQYLFAKSAPELAAQLQWAWNENGRPGGHHHRLPINMFIADPNAPAKAPELTSKAWDDYGFLFRNHVYSGKEIYFLLKNSRVEWHQEADEGSFHMFAKGVLLAGDGFNLSSADPPCTFCDVKKTDATDRTSQRSAFHHNLITFRGPGNDGHIRGQWKAFNSFDTVDFGHANIPNASTSAQGGWIENSYDRRCLLVKAKDPEGPEYFVIQDTTIGPHTPEWNLDVHSPMPTVKPDGKEGWVTFPGFTGRGFGVALDTIFVSPSKLDIWTEQGMIEKAYLSIWNLKGHSLLHAAPSTWPGGVDRKVDSTLTTPIYSMKFSNDLKYIAVGGSVNYDKDGKAIATDYVVKLLDRETGNPIRTFGPGTDIMFSCAISPDNRIVAGGNRGHLLLWEAETGRKLFDLPSPWTYGIAFSADASLVAAADYGDGKIRVWSVADGKLRQTIDAQSGKLFNVAFSRDGTRIAAAGEQRAAIFAVATGALQIAFGKRQGWEDGASGLDFSPNGSLLATGGIPNPTWTDTKITLWDATLPKGQKEPVARADYLWRIDKAHSNFVRAVSFSPDGKYLTTAGRENNAYIWDTVSGKQIRALTPQGAGIIEARWSPDGREVWLGTPLGGPTFRLASFTGGAITTRFFTILYPRYQQQPSPTVTPVAGGKGAMIQHAWGTDMVLASDTPIIFTQNGVKFEGRIAVLRSMKDETWMTLVDGTSLTWKNKTLTKPGVIKY
ncbi:MAG: WD40 repeat domain-containing protein [Armatimonadota bacterium]